MTPASAGVRLILTRSTTPATTECNTALSEGKIRMSKYLAIAIGGALGALARFLVGTAVVNRMGNRAPYATFVVNMTACVIIGFALTLLNRREAFNPLWRYLVPIGFIGAYSTFSTFEWETFAYLESGAFLIAALNVAGSVLFGLLAVWGGVLLGRLLP